MSIRARALFAQRTKQVFAHPVTWSRLIKERWRRPRKRVYSAKPKVGIRARRPNEPLYTFPCPVRCGIELERKTTLRRRQGSKCPASE
jgi:hypothetical protein